MLKSEKSAWHLDKYIKIDITLWSTNFLLKLEYTTDCNVLWRLQPTTTTTVTLANTAEGITHQYIVFDVYDVTAEQFGWGYRRYQQFVPAPRVGLVNVRQLVFYWIYNFFALLRLAGGVKRYYLQRQEREKFSSSKYN